VFELLLSTLYFFLPAYVANMCPVFAAAGRLPFGNAISPRLFGVHKTYRGIYASIIGAWLILLLQHYFQQQGLFENWRLLDYSVLKLWILGLLFGGGAALGDLVKSFFKRSIGKKEGAPWFPFDQLDFVIGALLLVSSFYLLDPLRILVLLVVSPVLHFLVNVLGYLLKLKDVWW